MIRLLRHGLAVAVVSMTLFGTVGQGWPEETSSCDAITAEEFDELINDEGYNSESILSKMEAFTSIVCVFDKQYSDLLGAKLAVSITTRSKIYLLYLFNFESAASRDVFLADNYPNSPGEHCAGDFCQDMPNRRYEFSETGFGAMTIQMFGE